MNKIKFKSIEKAIIAGFILSTLISLCNFSANCENISHEILRLHVLANSDSQEDQELKLKVKDKVNIFCSQLLENKNSKEEAISTICESLEKIEQVAQNEVYKNGYNYNVEAEFVNMYFNIREYESFTLPAGEYEALRINIGEAKGKNWWCVIFPELCINASQGNEKLETILSPTELKIVNNKEAYKLKLKSLELYENLKEYFI